MRYGRYLYYASLFMYIVFLTLLTTFSVVVPNPIEEGSWGASAYLNMTTCISNVQSRIRSDDSRDYSDLKLPSKKAVQTVCQYGIIVFAGASIFFEVVQFLRVNDDFASSQVN